MKQNLLRVLLLKRIEDIGVGVSSDWVSLKSVLGEFVTLIDSYSLWEKCAEQSILMQLIASYETNTLEQNIEGYKLQLNGLYAVIQACIPVSVLGHDRMVAILQAPNGEIFSVADWETHFAEALTHTPGLHWKSTQWSC